jgi:hypothetical protein
MAPKRRTLEHSLWNKHFAPGISSLKRAHLSKLRTAIRPSVGQFVITTVLLNISADRRVRALNFIRRSAAAFDEFEMARVSYNRFFRSKDPEDYFAALHHFEAFLAAAYQGHELLFGAAKRPFFDAKGEGRAHLNYRMTRLYNTAKHTEGFIRSSGFAGDTVSIWITNDGLSGSSERIAFTELEEIVEDMCIAASLLAKSYLWRGSPISNRLLAELFNISEDEIGGGRSR